jgi:DNA-binding NarL/FixJ family response regulator
MEISVLLVDHERLVLAGTRCLLERAGGFRVVAVAADLDRATEAAARHRPDVVLLDLSMPGCAGPDAVRRLRECRPGLAVVALAALDDAALAVEARAAGAVTVLVKDAEPGDLLAAIRRAAPSTAA